MLDEAISVALTELEQLVHVEAVRIDEKPMHRADPDHARPGTCAGARGAGTHLAESFDRHGRPLEHAPEMTKRGLCRGLDAMAGGEVVHAEPFVALRPERQLLELCGDEVGRIRAHVGACEEDVPERGEWPPIRSEDGVAVPFGEANAGLGAR